MPPASASPASFRSATNNAACSIRKFSSSSIGASSGAGFQPAASSLVLPHWQLQTCPSCDKFRAKGRLHVLIDGSNLWKLHRRWLVGTSLVALAAIGWTWVTARQTGRWPGGGSLSGLTFGLLA